MALVSSSSSRHAARLVIPAGVACNNACRFCDQVRRVGDGDEGGDAAGSEPVAGQGRASWEGGLAAAREHAVVVLSGWEPTLLPDLLERVRTLRDLGAREVWIQTNGRMLAYRRLAGDLAGAGLTGVECAVHGHEAALHDWITRVDGSFRQALRGARNARRAGLRLVVNTVLVRSNYRHLPAVASLCGSLGAERLRVHPVRPVGAAAAAASLVPPQGLAASYVRAARRTAARVGVVWEVAGAWAGREG